MADPIQPATDAEIAEARRLHAEATPPPWEHDGECYILTESGMVADAVHDEKDNAMPERAIARSRGFGWGAPERANLAAIAATHNLLPRLLARLERAEAALVKIDAIRNGIVGAQRVNISEHVYPLVAALDEAGFVGVGYKLAAENLGTLIERAQKAEAERDALRKSVIALYAAACPGWAMGGALVANVERFRAEAVRAARVAALKEAEEACGAIVSDLAMLNDGQYRDGGAMVLDAIRALRVAAEEP